MKILAKSFWPWSLLVTIPVTVVFFYWVFAVGDRYYDFHLRHLAPKYFNLKRVGEMELSHIFRQMKMSVLNQSDTEAIAGLRTLNLAVSEANIAKLDSHLPHSGTEYVKASFFYDGKFRKVKMRYRGDSIYHWGYYKKSIRIKTKRARLFEGMRSFNIVAPRTPEILNNHLVSTLAKRMGIMAPRSEVVNLNINGKLSGVYLLTEQLDESSLRSNRKMPGDLYSGDAIGRKRYSGLSNQLFESSFFWEKRAVNNHYPEYSKKPLERLISLLQADESEDVHRDLSSLLDMEAFGKFNALEILSTTAHVDAVHNWRLYYDPAKSKFIPIQWDFVGWHISTRPKGAEKARLDVLSSLLHVTLHKNGDFLRARQKALYDFFSNGEDISFLQEIDALYLPLKQAAMADPNFATNARTYSGGQINSALDSLKATIVRTFHDVREGYMKRSGDVAYLDDGTGSSYRIEVKGRAPVNTLVFKFKNLNQINASVRARLVIEKQGVEKEIDISGALRVGNSRIEVNAPLLAKYIPVIQSLEPGASLKRNRMDVYPAYYRVAFDGLPQNSQLLELLIDRGDGELEPARRLEKIESTSLDGMYNIIHAQPSKAPIIWRGDIHIEGVMDIDSELIIEPGTTVRFSPSASLILTNRVVAEGTSEKPVRFVAATDEQQNPWGAVVLKGQGANGSHFTHCEFSDGSGLKGDLFEYSAMFSVHDVKGVRISHCLFRDSKVVDDMVHAVYADIHVSDSVFINSKSDALDIDISHAVVERCRFIDSGNDAIDMMTTDGVVIDTFIAHSGDKGISVGEGSRLVAINNIISSNAIGVQSKDGSVAVLHNVTLESNTHSLDSYKKNWRYNSGGYTYVYKSVLIDNAKQVTADKKSRIKLYDTYIDQKIELGKKRLKRIYIDSTVDAGSQSDAKTTRLWRFPEELKKMKGMDQTTLNQVNNKRRGADLAAHQ